MKNTVSQIRFRRFEQQYQNVTKDLILAGLGKHWGKIDYNKNPDLNDIAKHYKNNLFMLGFLSDDLVATGGLIKIDAKVAEIVRVSVNRMYRRQGVGYSIVEKLVQTAKTQGFNKIILETTTVWHNVVSFWLKCGFKKTHTHNDDTYFERVI